jgi:hypothetical protein
MREAIESDLPKGVEAQCPVCWRIFTRNSVAERHKTYRPLGTTCADPASLGLVPKERRGLVVWSGPPPSEPLRRDAQRMEGSE